MSKVLLSLAVAAGVVVVASLEPALAAGSSSSWVDPAKEGVAELTNTLIQIAGALIGLALVAFGLWSAMVGRIDWAKIWVYFIAGVIVTVGANGVVWFMELVGGK